MPKIEPRLLKGFRDYGPVDQSRRQDMFRKIQTIFERFGFLPLSTPALEYKEILMGKYGEGEKLLYSFKDNGERDVAMRYDLTVPLARYVAQNQNSLQFPFKRYQIAPVWRADNPQKGRLREFYQCDIDVVLGAAPVADAEVVACAGQALEALGIQDYVIRLNDRKIFDAFADYFLKPTGSEAEAVTLMRAIDKFDKVGREGLLDELQQQKISSAGIKQAETMMSLGKGQEALANIEKVLPTAESAVASVRSLLRLITAQGIAEGKIEFDPLIVRGLDYYTGAVFEVILKDKREFGSIAGGGRYDNLLDTFSDKSLPGVGISLGIDRLYDALAEQGVAGAPGVVQVMVMNLEESLLDEYVKLVTELRAAGINSDLYYQPTKLDKQFKYAESKGIKYAVLVGADEASQGIVQLKNLQTREQNTLKRDELSKAIQQ